MFEDTPEFVARHIIREANSYLDGLAPPFFRALVDYAQDGSYSWHCPGHSGGVAFLKSPVGQMFHQFFGENMLRADVCNSVEELGQLLDHTGPVARVRAQRRAHLQRRPLLLRHQRHLHVQQDGVAPRRWRRATWSWSTATATSRSCTRSSCAGAIPVFLTPTRNHYGIIGPIPQSEFTPRVDRSARSPRNPLLAGVDAERRSSRAS